MTRSLILVALVLAGCAAPPSNTESQDSDEGAPHLTPGIFLDAANRDALPAGMTLRPIYPHGINVTKVSEKFMPRLYNDVANYCSIGYGHLVKKAPCDGTEKPSFLAGLSEPQATDLLTTDMSGAQITVMLSTRVELNDAKYAALCDFVYNVGPTNFKNSTLLRVVNQGQFDQVPAQMLRWVMAGGNEVQGLKNRRNREIALFFAGETVPTSREAPPADESAPIDIRTGKSK